MCIYWRRKWQLTPVFLPGESHGQKSLAGHGPQGRRESDMTEVTKHAHMCMYVCVYIYICIHTHTHTHTYIFASKGLKIFGAAYQELQKVIYRKQCFQYNT